MTQLYVGAKEPEGIDVTLRHASFDFSEVTSAALLVSAPGGTTTEWSWSLDASVPGRLKLSHTFDASGAELWCGGTWKLTGELATPAGNRRIKPITFFVSEY